MKNITFLLILFVAALASCNKDTKLTASDLEALQSRLNADADVAKARSLFSEHCRIAASFHPDELKSILAQVRSCGFYPSTATIPELKKCLSGNPHQEQFVKSEILLRDYEKTIKAILQRFPDLTQLPTRQRVSMIAAPIGDNDELYKTILSDYQAKQKK